MRVAPRAGVSEAEVGAAVDDDDVVGELRGQGRRVPVGQCEHDGVMAGEDVGGGVLEDPIGQRCEVRVDRPQALSGVRRGREGSDLELGVLEEEADHLSPGIATGTGHCNPLHAA